MAVQLLLPRVLVGSSWLVPPPPEWLEDNKMLLEELRQAQEEARMQAALLRRLEKTKDAAGCRERAERWEGLNRTDPTGLYNAACYRAVTAAVLPQDPKTPAADAARLAREEVDRAMVWLKQAVAAGYRNAAHMREDRDLDALRDRADFQELLTGVERAGAEKKPPAAAATIPPQ